MRNQKGFVLIAVLLIMAFMSWAGMRIIKSIQFDRGCQGYLKRAADANTVELALKQMEIAIKYIEEKNLTEGYTSILYKTPDEDIGYWYANLKAATEELRKVKPEATLLEKSNALMKLRETLLDDSQTGVKVTVPPGISVYPHNTFYAIWGTIGSVSAIAGLVILFIKLYYFTFYP